MQTRWENETTSGIRIGEITFGNPALKGHTCPIIELSGAEAGPRLCVMAGIHINEASSIAAAIAIAGDFDPRHFRGTLSIIPIVSTHNIFKYTAVSPPSGDRDLHWSYPGDPLGTFNDCLADALINEWAADADVLVDMHGGDLDERMARYVVIQSTGDPEFDARAEAAAACFDTPLVVALHASAMNEPGRCCTALAARRRIALVSEAGDFGMADPDSIAWHRNGIRELTALLGMTGGNVREPRAQQYLDQYEWITSPESGIVEKAFKPGDWIEEGACIGIVTDHYGREKAAIRAPQAGYVMMQKSLQFAPRGFWIGAVARPRG